MPYIKKINIQIHKNILFQKTSNISDIINLFSLLNTKNEHLLINTLLNGSIMCVSENQQLKCLFHKLIKKKPSLLIQHNKLKVLIYELGLPSTLTPDIHFLNACIHLPINESKKMITFHKDKIENKEEFMFENKLYSPGRLSLLKELDVELYKKVKHVMSNTKLLGLKNKDFINLLKTHLLNQAPNIQDINFEY